MAEFLSLRGGAALSAARLQRLHSSVSAVLPKVRGLEAEHWYFVELEAQPSGEELARLKDLLGAHPVEIGRAHV